jgi:hypothetical protein
MDTRLPLQAPDPVPVPFSFCPIRFLNEIISALGWTLLFSLLSSYLENGI